jgi:hypothetical protein
MERVDDAFSHHTAIKASRGTYGFIVPGTRTFAVFGSSGGVDSGIGYKITQDDGTLCGGYCSHQAADHYNYYWFFDLETILAAPAPYELRPYAFGRWSVPFDDNGRHSIIGGAFDHQHSMLYLALSGAGQVGTYDRPPTHRCVLGIPPRHARASSGSIDGPCSAVLCEKAPSSRTTQALGRWPNLSRSPAQVSQLPESADSCRPTRCGRPGPTQRTLKRATGARELLRGAARQLYPPSEAAPATAPRTLPRRR